MKLKRFRVTNFRSVNDSGWIEADDVTALIGTNESGKTNLLLPLWKLNPAKEGEIVPTADFPRKLFNEFRNQSPKPVFIRAVFVTDKQMADRLSKLTGLDPDVFEEVEVARRFDSEFVVDFPHADPVRGLRRTQVLSVLSSAERDLTEMNILKTGGSQKASGISYQNCDRRRSQFRYSNCRRYPNRA